MSVLPHFLFFVALNILLILFGRFQSLRQSCVNMNFKFQEWIHLLGFTTECIRPNVYDLLEFAVAFFYISIVNATGKGECVKTV